jgi:hypothetical protein
MDNTTHLRITDMPKEEQTRLVNMAERYSQYTAGNAYIPLQDLPKYESAFKQIHPTADITKNLSI